MTVLCSARTCFCLECQASPSLPNQPPPSPLAPCSWAFFRRETVHWPLQEILCSRTAAASLPESRAEGRQRHRWRRPSHNTVRSRHDTTWHCFQERRRGRRGQSWCRKAKAARARGLGGCCWRRGFHWGVWQRCNIAFDKRHPVLCTSACRAGANAAVNRLARNLSLQSREPWRRGCCRTPDTLPHLLVILHGKFNLRSIDLY